jgi:hypothetical protein
VIFSSSFFFLDAFLAERRFLGFGRLWGGRLFFFVKLLEKDIDSFFVFFYVVMSCRVGLDFIPAPLFFIDNLPLSNIN